MRFHRMNLDEWLAMPLYSTWEIDAAFPSYFDFFTYSQAQQLPGRVRAATQLDTNIPRSGYSGLPQAWEYLCGDWYAHVDGVTELAPEVAAWARTIALRFEYRDKPCYSASLFDVIERAKLDHNRELAIAGPDEPTQDVTAAIIAELEQRGLSVVHMQELLSYRVSAQATSKPADAAFRAWLAKREQPLQIRVSLFGAIKRCIV